MRGKDAFFSRSGLLFVHYNLIHILRSIPEEYSVLCSVGVFLDDQSLGDSLIALAYY